MLQNLPMFFFSGQEIQRQFMNAVEVKGNAILKFYLS